MITKLSSFVKYYTDPILLGILIVLVSLISFQIGRLSIQYSAMETQVKITQGSNIFNAINNSYGPENKTKESKASPTIQSTIPTDLRVVASKNSDKYHYLWCSGANRIKEQNRIYFNSAKEAENKGFVLAGNCTMY